MLKNEYEDKKAQKHYKGEQVFVYSKYDYEKLLNARNAEIEDLPAMAANNHLWRNVDKKTSFIKGAVTMFIATQVFKYFLGL